ncbi:hypothetical protein J3B02_003363 [Coemansia erecta]|nr:hypothetical protein J3B02_003363 [Coemansia erecta]KAJ2888114.1 hypothetical protein FB639_000863 [Coemansia asiatica]
MRLGSENNNGTGSTRSRIVLGGPQQSEYSDNSEGWPISRHHLSFDEAYSPVSERIAMTRRRVFARLAPPVHVELSLSSNSSSDESQSDEDGHGIAAHPQTAGRQIVLLPPTPPRRRTAESDGDGDLMAHADSQTRSTAAAAAAAAPAESADPDGAGQVLQALERFGQLRRQRFLQEQRLRMALTDSRQRAEATNNSRQEQRPYVLSSASMSAQADWTQPRGTMTAPDVTAAAGEPPDAIVARGNTHHLQDGSTSSSAAALGDDDLRAAFWQQFPSNDVDSYWYNQPDAAEASNNNGAAADSSVHRGESRRRPVPLRRLGHLPSIARNPAAEESRRAMLEVIRMHGSTFSSNNSDDSDQEMLHNDIDAAAAGENSSSARIRQRQQYQQSTHPYAPMRMQHPSWLAAAMDMHVGRPEKSEPVESAPIEDSQQTLKMKARAEEQLVRWLIKNTVPACPLDCSLLTPGIEFIGEQHIGSSGSLSMQMHRQRLGVEKWDVHVVIQSVDMANGRVAGTMRAINVPRMPRTVETHWEGEVVDFVNYTPLTGKWHAKCKEDTEHWSMFDPVKSQPQT